MIESLKNTLRNADQDDIDLVNQIIERGRILGLELLMPVLRRGGWNGGRYHRETVNHDMSFVPDMPEMFIRIINRSTLGDAEVAYITKEVFA